MELEIYVQFHLNFVFKFEFGEKKRAKNDRFSRVSLRRKSQVFALLQLLKDTRAPKIVIFFSKFNFQSNGGN